MQEQHYEKAIDILSSAREKLASIISYEDLDCDAKALISAEDNLSLIIQTKIILTALRGGRITDGAVALLDRISDRVNVITSFYESSDELSCALEAGNRDTQTKVYTRLSALLSEQTEMLLTGFRSLEPMMLKDALDELADNIEGICTALFYTDEEDRAPLPSDTHTSDCTVGCLFTEIWEQMLSSGALLT